MKLYAIEVTPNDGRPPGLLCTWEGDIALVDTLAPGVDNILLLHDFDHYCYRRVKPVLSRPGYTLPAIALEVKPI